jgi:hypothetical protein
MSNNENDHDKITDDNEKKTMNRRKTRRMETTTLKVNYPTDINTELRRKTMTETWTTTDRSTPIEPMCLRIWRMEEYPPMSENEARPINIVNIQTLL